MSSISWSVTVIKIWIVNDSSSIYLTIYNIVNDSNKIALPIDESSIGNNFIEFCFHRVKNCSVDDSCLR